MSEASAPERSPGGPDPGTAPAIPLGAGMAEPVDRDGAFPRLTDEQRARLLEHGALRQVHSGEILFREGDSSYDFFVVESGAVAIVEGYGCDDRVIAVHGQHRFLGELNMFIGSRAFLTAVVRDDGEVIQVPAKRLRGLLAQDDELSDLILRAYLARRSILIGIGAGVKLIGSRYTQDTRRLREFLARNRVPHHWMDLEEDADAEALLQALDICPAQTPVVVGAREVLRNPSNSALAKMLGLGPRGAPPALCDLVIVGGGPAGLAAAVYGASEGLDTQAIDAVAFGGQAGTSSRIENYLGFPTGISGNELAARATLQARKFGARVVVPAQAVGLAREDDHYAVQLADGQVVNGRTVIIATGAHYRRLDVPECERFEGEGIYYAATQAEALRCSGAPVVIVGGGNSAGQAALFLARHAGSCHLLIRGGDLGKSMSRYLVEEIERHPEIEVRTWTEVVGVEGDGSLQALELSDSRTAARAHLDARALFVFVGADPRTEWLQGQVAMDGHGFVLTGRDAADEQLEAHGSERPFFLETSRPGIFAVGDVHSGSIKRVASAVGEGSMAVRLVHQRLAGV